MLPPSGRCWSAITLLLLIWGLNAITIIYTMTRGGPANRSLITPIQIFRQAFESSSSTGGGAVGDVLRRRHRLRRDLHPRLRRVEGRRAPT